MSAAETLIGEEAQGTAAAMLAARRACRQRDRDFYQASVFVPRTRRDGACAIVAMCRMIDDLMRQPDQAGGPPPAPGGAGSCCSVNSLDQRIDLLRQKLEQMYDNRLELPRPEFRAAEQNILAAVAWAVARFEVPRQLFIDFAEGIKRDLGISRYATWRSLEQQLDRTAGPVAMMLGCVLGMSHSEAGQRLAQIGRACALTRILHDLRQDWSASRLYLPLEDMARCGYSERDFARGAANERLEKLLALEAQRAKDLYRAGSEGICWLSSDGARLSVSWTVTSGLAVLDAITRNARHALDRGAHLTTAQKLRRLPAAWRLARREADEPLPRVFG